MMPRILKKALKIFLWFHGFLLVVLVMTHCSFSRYVKRSFEAAGLEKPYDVIIVPGVPYQKDAESSVMKRRVFWAKYLYDNGYAQNIIFSGSAVYSPYSEGIVMKQMADSLGVNPEHSFSETTAEHSTENVYYSWRLAKKMGFKKIALATDPFQSRLLRRFMRKYCPDVSAVPIVFDVLDLDNVSLPAIDPKNAYRHDFVSITRRDSFWKRLTGTLGKRVKDQHKAEVVMRNPK